MRVSVSSMVRGWGVGGQIGPFFFVPTSHNWPWVLSPVQNITQECQDLSIFKFLQIPSASGLFLFHFPNFPGPFPDSWLVVTTVYYTSPGYRGEELCLRLCIVFYSTVSQKSPERGSEKHNSQPRLFLNKITVEQNNWKNTTMVYSAHIC